MSELENVLAKELDRETPDLEAIGRAWVRQHAAALLAGERLRRERQAAIEAAQAALDEAMAQERERWQELRRAIDGHERILLTRQRLWNARHTPQDPQAHRRQLGELDAAAAKWLAEREIRANEYEIARRQTEKERQRLEMLRAGGDDALR